jgi:hypothetical protein
MFGLEILAGSPGKSACIDGPSRTSRDFKVERRGRTTVGCSERKGVCGWICVQWARHCGWSFAAPARHEQNTFLSPGHECLRYDVAAMTHLL